MRIMGRISSTTFPNGIPTTSTSWSSTGAGSHTSGELKVPDNMRIITLPPYSPELNPVEQIWDLIRERHFANWVLANALQRLDDTPAELQTLANRTWIQTACLD